MQERTLENYDPNSFNVKFARVVVAQVILDMKREFGLISEPDFAKQSLRLAEDSKNLIVGVAQRSVKCGVPDIVRVSQRVIECGQSDSLLPAVLEKEFLEATFLLRSPTNLN